ncbi:MAG: SecY-interacting protein Syd [Clostridiales bacterium]|jgi:hypothetical protein|nr:SecY-interacting protein Syd [Clostridiales bacterium]
MKEAFDGYFDKLNEAWLQKTGFRPQVPFVERLKDTGLYLVDTLNEYDEGYAAWRPKLQTEKTDFEPIEKKLGLGFEINPQIKDYISVYWFMGLEGKRKGNVYYFPAILPVVSAEYYVENFVKHGKSHFDKNQIYIWLGHVCAGADDSFQIYVNNGDCGVFAVQVLENKSIKVADSIEELIDELEAVL